MILKRILCCLLACLFIAAFLVGCNKDGKNDKGASSDQTSVSATEAPKATFDIETKYGTLKYPEMWKDKVKVAIEDGDVYSVKFTSDDTPLFDLLFGEGEGDIIGSLTTNGETTVVRVKAYNIEPKSKNFEEKIAMLNDVNVVIEHLVEDYELKRDDVGESASDEVFEIETSVTTLYYPSKWKDDVTVETDSDGARFSSGGVKLFDLLFNSAEGDLIGSFDGTDISVLSYEIKKKALTDSEYTKLMAMQDAVNVVIDHLRENEKFK